ncbi:plasmid mobilization relaxosome protein MobC [Streptomyces sp. NPDC093224]|uniref:plasmid mobilization relaxosome protein MobC n=1 Tax=Streptomyces sp. NPDC093224 TaxID=3155198 RepID=UPI00344A552B
MHDQPALPSPDDQQQAAPISGTDRAASWRFGHSPAGVASEPEPAPGVAGTVPRQGARDGEAAAEGGPLPGRRRGKPRVRAGKQRPAHSVRLTEPEYLRIAGGADAVGMSVAGFLATSGLAAARDLDRTAAVIATTQDVLTTLFALRRQLGIANNNLNQAVKALHLGVAPEGLDDTIAAVLRAAEDIRRVTTRMTNPEGTQAA